MSNGVLLLSFEQGSLDFPQSKVDRNVRHFLEAPNREMEKTLFKQHSSSRPAEPVVCFGPRKSTHTLGSPSAA